MAFANTLLSKTRISKDSARILTGPVFVLLIMAMLILPLPPFLLDFFFTFNIALSVMVLLASMFTKRTLEFSSFPTVLLFTTLLRLSLNVASARLVLMDGYQGPGAAGHVIEAFGHFMVGSDFAVGLVVFLILVTINFVVITKGATRIAEVGARFMLDAMPGKQMAIDADLNAGLINETQARERRTEVATEADFYGSMDGAAKFVRGDAIAALIIMAVNLIGGLLVGVIQHHMSFGQAVETYTLLTIGDGLVAQLPSLVVSTAAGVTVARVNTSQDMGEQITSQLFTKPRVIWLVAGVMGLLGVVPGMPNGIFLFFTVALAGLAWSVARWQRRAKAAAETVEPVAAPATLQEASWDDVRQVDPVALAIGHRLIPMVDPGGGGGLSARIKSARKKFAREVGFLPPIVHIRDDLKLRPTQYAISINDARVASGTVEPGFWLAINPGNAVGDLEGATTTDPAFGLPATWITDEQREDAQAMGYTVVDTETVIATHVNQVLRDHASALLGRAEVQTLLDRVGARDKALVEDTVPKLVSLATLQRVLRNLLDEDVPVRDLRTVLDTLAEVGDAKASADTLTVKVREALGPATTARYFGDARELHVIGLDAELAALLDQAVRGNGALEPAMAESLLRETERAAAKQEAAREPGVLVVPASVRPLLARFLRHRLHNLAVLALDEIPEDRTLMVTQSIGAAA